MDYTTVVDKPEQNYHYAGFWIRLLAAFIDSLILSIGSSIVFGNRVVNYVNGVYVHFDGPYILIPLLYTIIFWVTCSATPGKLLLKLQIIKENGEKLDIKTAIIRYFGYIPSLIVFCVGFIWIGADAKKQGWHDKIAKTYVIHK